jgi:DDE superfamily endonuclease
LLRNPDAFFEDNAAYVVGDSAYGLINWVMQPYSKNSIRKNADGTEWHFNALLSSARVNVEHAFGRIKSWFPLMKELSFVLGTQPDNQRVADRLTAMCVIHNFILDLDDIWEPTDAEMKDIDTMMDEAYEGIVGSLWMNFMQHNGQATTLTRPNQKRAGVHKCAHLKEQMLNWRGRPIRRPGWWRSRHR